MPFTLFVECFPGKGISSPDFSSPSTPFQVIIGQVIICHVIICQVSLHDILSDKSVPG
jgi:hypothetical protein